MWRRGAKAESGRPATCIVRHAYYPDFHVRRDAESLVEAGYDVSIIALRRQGQPKRERLNGVEVYRMPVKHERGSTLRYAWEYTSFALFAFLTVARLHLRRCFRVVEVDNMPDILVFAALVPKLTGTPVILYIFDQMPELFAHLRSVSPRHPGVRLLAMMERVAATFADRVIVTQEMTRRVLIGRGVPEEKVSVILNCPDEGVFTQNHDIARLRRDDRFEIVTHGVVLERYGIHVLLDAVPAITRTIPELCVHVFGDGEYRGHLEEQSRRMGLTHRVTFHGYAPLEDLLYHLHTADVGYVGMQCDLMLSNKLVEYAALEVPAVVARWPTYEHYFSEDEVTYFDHRRPEDLARAILALHDDPTEAAAKARRAQSRYQSYRWPVQRGLYLSIYDALASRSRRTRRSVGEPSESLSA